MKHIMYVFSGTGNTLHIAKLVKDALTKDDVLIQPITERGNERDSQNLIADIIGIYFPCYYGSIPNIVKNFASHLKVNKDTYIYSVSNAGGNTGYANKALATLLAQNGSELSFGADIIYSSNYMPGWYYKMASKSQEEVKTKLNDFIKATKKIAERIEAREKTAINGSYMGYITPKLMSPSYLVEDSRPHDREFSINNKCDKCGLCTKVCPVGNIKIENGKHIFNHNCQRCMACIQYCPKQAFEIKGKPMNKERYVNPFITINEVIELHHGYTNLKDA